MTELEKLEEDCRSVERWTLGAGDDEQNQVVKRVTKAARAHAEALKQEPVGYLSENTACSNRGVFLAASEKEWLNALVEKGVVTNVSALYTAPQATPDDLHVAYLQGRADEKAAREPLKLPNSRGGHTAFNEGWNACIEETNRLNGVV